MRRRQKMSFRRSRKSFRRSSGSRRVNHRRRTPMRGGIRF